MNFSVQTVFQILIIFQAFFFSTFLLVSERRKKVSNLILALFLFLWGVQMWGFVLKSLWLNNIIVNFNNSFGFTYGVLLYLYTKSLIYKDFKLVPSDIFHFFPFLIIVILDFSTKIESKIAISFLYVFSILTYVFFSFREISRYRAVLKQTQSDFEQQNLSWLRLVFFLFIGVFMFDFVQLFFNLFSDNNILKQTMEILVFMSVLAFISVLIFKALIRPEIFLGIDKKDKIFIKRYSVKYASSSLSKDEKKAFLEHLKNYMNTNKPFLEPALSINKLANSLGISSRDLSQIINEDLNQNFLDYINSKRIYEAINLLVNSKDKKQTIQEVMYSVGFSSKSSFYSAFRKKTGVTPKKYLLNENIIL